MNTFEKVSFEQYKPYAVADDAFHEYAHIKLPCRATLYSAGYDFYAPFTFVLEPGESRVVPTGVRVQLDNDKFLALYPRSGLGFKFLVGLANTVGVVDADYYNSDNEGHIMIKLVNNGDRQVVINNGTAFAQGIITQYFTVANERVVVKQRNGGFGSTGGI